MKPNDGWKKYFKANARQFFWPGEVVYDKQNNIVKIPDLWPNLIMLWCIQSY
jgi:hypothetical protein